MNKAEIAIEQLQQTLDFICTYPDTAIKTIETLLVEKYGIVGENVEPVVRYIVAHKVSFDKILVEMATAMKDSKLTMEEALKISNLIWTEFGMKIDPQAVWALMGEAVFSFENAKVKLFRLAKNIKELE